MSVFGIFEPSLAWPKSARIGFYGPRQRRRPMRLFCQSRWKFLLGTLLEVPKFLFPPLEASKSAFGELLARKSRAGGVQGAPGGRFLETCWLPKLCFFLLFVRASVAWCFSLAFGQFVVRLSFCLKDVRAPRANGAHADYIIKTNGFKHISKLCFRAGERRGEQNTHGSGKKTHAKTAPKKQTFL